MTDFTLPRAARLSGEAAFLAVRRRGVRLKAHPLRVQALVRRGGAGLRLGMAVSRKIGGAVVRNRWKRAVREAFRLHRHEIDGAWDVVVSVAWDAGPEEVAHVEQALVSALEQLAARGGKGK